MTVAAAPPTESRCAGSAGCHAEAARTDWTASRTRPHTHAVGAAPAGARATRLGTAEPTVFSRRHRCRHPSSRWCERRLGVRRQRPRAGPRPLPRPHLHARRCVPVAHTSERGPHSHSHGHSHSHNHTQPQPHSHTATARHTGTHYPTWRHRHVPSARKNTRHALRGQRCAQQGPGW